jgi:molybdopterin-guanine dinucleotide biosynthesis protein A
MTEPGNVTGIVLAGGRSSRFGSPKLEVEIDGASLLALAVDAVAVVADDVIVALAPEGGAPQIAAAEPPSALRFVRDREPFGGPLSGLAGALAAADRPIAIVVAGDMPRLSPEVLRAMLDALEAGDAVVLGDAEGFRPLPLVVRIEPGLRAARATLEAGERSLRAMLARLRVAALGEARWRALDPTGGTLIDIDQPSDLEHARDSQT